MSRPQVLLLGTCDTKLAELLYVKDQIGAQGVYVLLADVGRTPVAHKDVDVTHSDLFTQQSSLDKVASMDRSEAITTLSSAATGYTLALQSENKISGAICIGGSGGTSLGASVMRVALPIGFPKLIVSTVASGDTKSYIGTSDITIMNSVVDIAGLNSILKPILENAASMITSAAKTYQKRLEESNKVGRGGTAKRKCIAITMFGVTTPAANEARAELEKNGYEVIVFHASGQGGQAMEDLILQGRFDGVLDLTTSELTDEMIGGTMKGGPNRLTAASKMCVPQVVTPGALEIVCFGPKDTVPERFRARAWYAHNPDVTLMRTSKEESRRLGELFAEKLRKHTKRKDLVKVVLSKGGLSMISTSGAPFADLAADEALFTSISEGLDGTGVEVVEDSRAINDEGFALDLARELSCLMERTQGQQDK